MFPAYGEVQERGCCTAFVAPSRFLPGMPQSQELICPQGGQYQHRCLSQPASVMQRWGESHARWQRDPAPDAYPACVGSGSQSYHLLLLGHHYPSSSFLMFFRLPILTLPHCNSSPGTVGRHPAWVPAAHPLQMRSGSGEQVVTPNDGRCMMCNMTCIAGASAASFHLQAPRKELRIPGCSRLYPLTTCHRGDSHPALPLTAFSM